MLVSEKTQTNNEIVTPSLKEAASQGRGAQQDTRDLWPVDLDNAIARAHALRAQALQTLGRRLSQALRRHLTGEGEGPALGGRVTPQNAA